MGIEKLKLSVEMIPKTCYASNVRTLIPTKYWNIIRKDSYEKAGHECEICGDTGKNQGYRHNVECHEIWNYDDITKTQILLGLISLCVKCHQAKHFGRATAIGKQAEILKHMEVVNDWTHKDCVRHLAYSMIEWIDRSQYKWKINLDILNEEYDVPKTLIESAEKKRLLGKEKIKPWKRKNKKK